VLNVKQITEIASRACYRLSLHSLDRRSHGRLRRASIACLPVVGYLESRSRSGDAPFRAAFHQGLNEAGYVEGKNVIIEIALVIERGSGHMAISLSRRKLIGQNFSTIVSRRWQGS
jgi:hypothetical protein